MQTINYDFSGLEKTFSNLKRQQDSRTLDEIQKELNKFYKDSNCKEVIYTKNTDKMFFGMCVMPLIRGDILDDMIKPDPIKKRIDGYYLEIDSKLLDLNLSNREMVAILLHEVGHIVNDTRPCVEVQNALQMYIAKSNDTLDTEQYFDEDKLFILAIQDAIHSSTSIFKRKDEEMIADEFSVRCGYGRELETAYKKIIRNIGTLNANNGTNKFLTLQWTLRIYKDLGLKRIYAIKTLNKAMSMTGSELQKRSIRNTVRGLNKCKEGKIVQEASLFKKASDIYKKIKFKGVRSLEDELYEINLRAKNVDEHDDALILIRQINTRMAIIEDYMATEKLDQKDLERWDSLLNKYRMVREEVSKKTTYDEKFYGLFVEMPSIRSRYEM